MESKKNYITTCPQELVPLLAEELSELGASSVTSGYKAVSFSAEQEVAYRIHLCLRTASRIFQKVKHFPLLHPDQLRKKIASIPWPQLLSAQGSFKIDITNASQSPRSAPPFLYEKVIREGILEAFRKTQKTPPKVDLKNPKIGIRLYIDRGMDILIDTSGKSLHKRGYRVPGHPAPLKETLAAAILRFAGYTGQTPLLDPMCGSGTIAIEAAYLSLNKAPLIHRKKGQFGLEWMADFDTLLWRKTILACQNQKKESLDHPIYANDHELRFTELCHEIAIRARVEKFLTISQKSFFDQQKPAPTGILATNLPYGARLQDKAALSELYQNFGNYLKSAFTGWTAALLVGKDSPYKKIGLHADRKIQIMNGDIPCLILIYQLYQGRRKNFLASQNSEQLVIPSEHCERMGIPDGLRPGDDVHPQ